MGVTAYQAEMHARKALEYSLGKGEGGIFQIDEEEKIQGPWAWSSSFSTA